MRATARAPGMFGVLAEGLLAGGIPFSVACPVDFLARAEVRLHERTERDAGDPPPAGDARRSPVMAAAMRALAHWGRPDLDAHILVGESIPRAGVLGHGSAEVSAVIAAAGRALGENPAPETIAEIALTAGPAGGVMLPGLAVFDHYGGQVMESMGPTPPLEIVALDFGGAGIPDDASPDYRRRWAGERARSGEALALVRRGVAEGSPALVGRGASLTAAAAAAAYPELAAGWRLDAARDFAHSIGAVGIIAGRGPVGVLLDATQRRGKSAFLKAGAAFADLLTISHYRVVGGGVRAVDSG